jgi:hypothetical protein
MPNPLDLRPWWWGGDVAAGARLLSGLPGFLRHPTTVDQAREILRWRLHNREARFAALVRRVVYEHGANPYRRLLDIAGCEAGDFARLVALEGVEGSLRSLYRQGVFLTLDELKGRRPVCRGSTSFAVDPGQFANPYSARQLVSQTSGSRGRGTSVIRDLPYIRDVGVDRCLWIAARGGLGWTQAHWGSPGITLAHVLELAGFGMRPVRWFSFIDMASPDLPPRYRWSVRLVPWGEPTAGDPAAESALRPDRRSAPDRSLDRLGLAGRSDAASVHISKSGRSPLPGSRSGRDRPPWPPAYG